MHRGYSRNCNELPETALHVMRAATANENRAPTVNGSFVRIVDVGSVNRSVQADGRAAFRPVANSHLRTATSQ